MNTSHVAALYVSAGRHMRAVLSGGMTGTMAADQILALVAELEKLEFSFPKSELERMAKDVAANQKSYSTLSDYDGRSFHTMLKCVESSVTREAGARMLIALQESDVSAS
jgi:hypothetical protein